ncbi:MAG TPA: FAD-binding oxidoreductase, partial [Caulobacteraceae bacterium]|nr:FAD-binding oxidoreductase [Caulobacteraceae bacterium]
PTYARASTALAAGGIRQQFSTPENILMSQFGYRFFEEIGERLAVGDQRPDIGLAPKPYVRLAAEAGVAELTQDCALQRRLGAASRLVDQAELARLYPWMAADGVAAAIVGGAGEGMFDPYGMLRAFRGKAMACGAAYYPTSAVGMDVAAGRVTAVRLADGERLGCGVVVNAAGPRAASVAAMAGLELPVIAVKAHTFAFQAAPIANCPIVLDQAQGLQFKPEGSLFVCGSPRHERRAEAAPDDFDADYDVFETAVWPLLANRVPAFEALRLTRAWVGHIEVHPLDGNPILGPHPQAPNFFFVNGFSGHGAQHAPAAGRAIAELILHGAYQSLDLSRFGYERVLRGEPVAERV